VALAQTSVAPAVAPLPAYASSAQDQRVTIDGRLDDAVWSKAPRFGDFQRFRPSVAADVGGYRTEVQVIIERDALVFGIRAFDPTPADIRAPLARRDQVLPQQDSVTVWIDPTGRGQGAQFVIVNPRGSIGDGLYDAATDNDDLSPDFSDVEAAAERTAEGYTVELRWPLANLRYPLDSALPWRVMVSRRVPREGMTTYTSAPLPRDTPHLLTRMHALDDDRALRDNLRGAQHLTIRPELTLRHTSPREPGQRNPQVNLGVEAQWRPHADWVLDATLRPDFSQVEIDEPQLNGNTAFALFLQEKRAFFLESSEVVGQVPPDDFGTSRGLVAFYSRAIIDPRWGVRATHRGQDSQATAMLLRDAGGGLVLRPNAFGTDAVVARQASQVLFARHTQQVSDSLRVSALASVRDWGDGASTQVAGVDAAWQLTEGTQLRGHWLGNANRTLLAGLGGGGATGSSTAPRTVGEAPQTQRDQAWWLSGRTRQGDWRYTLDAERIGVNFVNDNGFVPQSGIDRLQVEAHRGFTPDNAVIARGEWHLRWMGVDARRDERRGLREGQSVSRIVQPGYWVQTAFGLESWGYVNVEQLRVRPGGVWHKPLSLTLGGTFNPGPRWTLLGFDLGGGQGVDTFNDRQGQSLSLGTTLQWRVPLPHGMDLEWEQRGAYSRISSRSDAAGLDQRSLQTKVLLHLSREQAVRLVWQQRQAQRDDAAGVLLEGTRARVATLTWLAKSGALRGWSVGAAQARNGTLPAQREVFVKYQQRL
jgi:hypothetical protein